ncbi:FKBP-type peptidyl-prolyl cis-trans isomerase [Actinomyces bowdenii]|uniref:FKBP-type peptidyl-prolyl cis-trans isomerase n=1 Tax=Actinomyces bowdenii TaxID=131109 RepID=UPI001ABC4366|nr:FKBP-type peptidyl-prolyl cis-trans isomerase [Actinomyces bowdenii]
MRRTPLTLTTLALAACLTLAGCGQSSTEPDATASSSAPVAAPTPVDCATVTVDSDAKTLPTLSGSEGQEPAVSWGGGEAPENLTVKTLSQGEGAEISAEDTVVVNYVGWKWGDQDPFDTSWKPDPASATASATTAPTPMAFSLSGVIPGWTCGLQGAHVGDRLLMSIPGELAYGEQATGPEAAQQQSQPQGPPTGDLVFFVDVLGGGSPEEIAAGTKDAVMEGEAALAERGVSVSGNLGEAATLSIEEGAAEPTEYEVIVLARGSGAPLEVGSQFLAHIAGSPWPGAGQQQGSQPSSTWEQNTPQVIAVDEQQLKGLVGVPAGSRVVVLAPKDDSTGVPAGAFIMDVEQVL